MRRDILTILKFFIESDKMDEHYRHLAAANDLGELFYLLNFGFGLPDGIDIFSILSSLDANAVEQIKLKVYFHSIPFTSTI